MFQNADQNFHSHILYTRLYIRHYWHLYTILCNEPAMNRGYLKLIVSR